MVISYVTYDEEGNLTGFYNQKLQPEHADCYIKVDDPDFTFWMVWTDYRANATRDGLELIPPPDPAP